MSALLKRRRAIVSYSLCSVVTLLIIAGCRPANEPPVNTSPETIVFSTPPFQTKEPDRYRATRVITITEPNGETVVTTSSVAKDGEMRRNESEMASRKVVYLDSPEGKFVLLPDEAVYAEFTSNGNASTSQEGLEISPEQLLHNETGVTTYQKLGAEMIGGRNSNKYRVVVNDSTSANVGLSETLIWIDEELNMPVRSETTEKDGTRITMELSNLALQVDKAVFEVPDGYKEISFSELRKRLVDKKVR